MRYALAPGVDDAIAIMIAVVLIVAIAFVLAEERFRRNRRK